MSWHRHVREEWKEKEELADQMFNFLLIKHSFQSWRFVSYHIYYHKYLDTLTPYNTCSKIYKKSIIYDVCKTVLN